MLDAYSRVQTARTAVVNLSDLKQGNTESVADFGSRVACIVDDLEILMPAASRVPTGVAWEAAITALAGWNGIATDIKGKNLHIPKTRQTTLKNPKSFTQIFSQIQNARPTIPFQPKGPSQTHLTKIGSI